MTEYAANPNCEIDFTDGAFAYAAEDLFTLMDTGPDETDFKLAESAGELPPTRGSKLAEIMEAFFEGPGAGRVYETNALAEAIAPDRVTANRIKEFLGKAANYKELAHLRSKGSVFAIRGKTAMRNAWSSRDLAERRRNGEKAGDLVKSPKRGRSSIDSHNIYHLTIDDALALLLENGYHVLHPDQVQAAAAEPNVVPVDKPEISRQFKPGYAPVTCGDCGGTGRVFMRKD